MSTAIYYFSATGNSLQLAREVASRLGGCKTVPIGGSRRDEPVTVPPECAGFVFPVYAWGLPRIVAEFLERVPLAGSKYVFAIATCVAIPGNTLNEFDRLVRAKGARLDAGFAVSARRSSLMKLNALDRVMIALDQKRKQIRSGEERLDEIAEVVKRRERRPPETSSWAASALGSLFHTPALDRFKTMDAGFVVHDSCKGCGTCVKVCPRSNIELVAGRPVVLHDCEFCHGCIQWCPSFEIRHPGFDAEPKQYRNPSIPVGDLVRG